MFTLLFACSGSQPHDSFVDSGGETGLLAEEYELRAECPETSRPCRRWPRT